MNRQEHLLVIAAEECAEVAQRLSKALRFGLHEIEPGQSLTNAQRVMDEFYDLVAVMGMLQAHGLEEHADRGMAASQLKTAKVDSYLEYSRALGTLE